MPKSLLYASLSVGANEMKYLLNSFAIILRFIISSLFITKLGFNYKVVESKDLIDTK